MLLNVFCILYVFDVWEEDVGLANNSLNGSIERNKIYVNQQTYVNYYIIHVSVHMKDVRME